MMLCGKSMKKIPIKPLLIGMAIPVLLNIIATVMALHGMAGGTYSDTAIGIVYTLANLPTVVMRIYPYEISQTGERVYDMFGWYDYRVFVVNIFIWSLIGLISYTLFSKYRKPSKQI